MRLKIKHPLVLCVVCMALMVSLFGGGSPVFADGIVAIVNAANNVSEISLSDLKKMCLMKKRKWPNGKDIMVWLPAPGSETMDALLSSVLAVPDETALKKYYISAIFMQIITDAPAQVTSDREAAKKVADHVESLAIVKGSEAIGIPGIKILKVEGL